MGLAEDPSTRDKLNGVRAAEVVAASYWSWVSCARYLSEIGVRDLFRVLDAGERWLVATGHQDWRAAILSERASVHRQLREMDEAVANAQEALAVKEQYRAAPGFTLSTHRSQLGDALRSAGRSAEAVPHYQAILADPAATTWGRDAAHIGLTWCSLDRRDFALAIQHARAAVQLAERLGDDALCVSLDALAAACRLVEATWRRHGGWRNATWRWPGGSAATTGLITPLGRPSTWRWTVATWRLPPGCCTTWNGTPPRWTRPPRWRRSPTRSGSAASGSTPRKP